MEEDSSDIALEGDAIAGSLFERINRPHSGLHVLIGAKKFMEGWNSWRVASMGLLNIGRKEGSQIIQLKGQDTGQDRVKRRYLDEWIQAVNAHGGFGRWAAAVAKNPGEIRDILVQKCGGEDKLIQSLQRRD
ncbi:MAG TPA: hypothetical protein PLW12_02165 [Methanothrix sp.]|nr:hypothetical protein [Methanothrix sp.]HPO88086.1 hypothetical protein [Methanothrix sp.]